MATVASYGYYTPDGVYHQTAPNEAMLDEGTYQQARDNWYRSYYAGAYDEAPNFGVDDFNNYWTPHGYEAISLGQAPSSGDGGGGGEVKVLNQAALDNNRKAIDSLGTELEVGYDTIEGGYNSLIGRYDRDRTRTKGDYDENIVTNNKNLSREKQNALLAAAQGRRGLRGTLAALGALSGDGSVLADRAVTTAANQDIGGATDTFATNALSLDKAWDRYDEEDEQRRAEADTARTNQRTALEGSIAGKRQGLYKDNAGLYADVDDTSNAKLWLDRAGDLNDTIARKSAVQSTPFSERGAAFTPGTLESYLAGAGDMTVSVREGGNGGFSGPSTIVAGRGNSRRREREEALV